MLMARLLCLVTGHRWLFAHVSHPSIEGVAVVKFCGRCRTRGDR